MHHLKGSILFLAIIAISIIFLGASSTPVSAPDAALSPYPDENTVITGGTPYSEYPGSEHGSNSDDGYDEDEDEDDSDDQAGYDEREDETEPDDTNGSEALLNNTLSASNEEGRALLVVKIRCQHYLTGSNISGAVDSFMKWGRYHNIHTKHWHWDAAEDSEGMAIIWQCNCRCVGDQPVERWELLEGIRLVEEKCGPGQAGRVYLERYAEIGVGSFEALLKKQRIKGRRRSMCALRGCCGHHPHQEKRDQLEVIAREPDQAFE